MINAVMPNRFPLASIKGPPLSPGMRPQVCNMPAVKKVGSFIDFVPSLDELGSIRFVKMIALNWIREQGEYNYRFKYGKSGLGELRAHWQAIRYYKSSKTLSTLLDAVAKEFIFNKKLNDYNSAGSVDYRKLERYYQEVIVKIWGDQFDSSEALLDEIQKTVHRSEDEPVKLILLGSENDWIFKGFHYSTEGPYSDNQFGLLILEEFDKERRYFERLKQKYDSLSSESTSYSRPGIPENVRIEVWRRDSGKCARCGSRENLEYDHIIPLSRGGSNTARNIELLCEKCNRGKSDKIE